MADLSPTETFQVELRGMVDLLSQHLYSGPQVYLRELIQNATDAITARRELDPSCPAVVTLTPADVATDGCLHVRDTGVGLTPEDMRRVLATIGASTKRDELGFQRDRFLGQFGIGLLSSFLVSDEISLRTRPGTEETWCWTAYCDGRYVIRPAAEPLPSQGSEVVLLPRGGDLALLTTDVVRKIAKEYAAHLPVELRLETAAGEEVLNSPLPWDLSHHSPAEHRRAAVAWCETTLGFTPLDLVELGDPGSATRGIAFVLPTAAGERATHRLYSRRMLVGDAVDGLLPSWAFFVKAVLDSDCLRLTASREALHDDDALADARSALGDQLKRWLVRMTRTDQERARRFFDVHHLGVKAMAAQDDDMLDFVAGVLPFETTHGHLSLDDFAELSPVLTYVERTDHFHQLAALATHLDLPVLNAGYAYDTALIAKWVARHPGRDARRLRPSDLVTEFADLPAEDEQRFAALRATAQSVLSRAQCRVAVRSFEPRTLQAVFLTDPDADREADRATVAQDSEGAWLAALDAIAAPDRSPQFVLNAANDAVRRAAEAADPELRQLAVEAIYAHTLVSGRHPLRSFDASVVARALPALIDRVLHGSLRPDRDETH